MWKRILFVNLILAVAVAGGIGLGAIELSQRYSTTLIAGDTSGERARAWEFTERDVFRLSEFHFEVGDRLRLTVGEADVGIGHCADGAVWAVVIPREEGKLVSPMAQGPEAVAHVWLRFHPREISKLFPPDTVSTPGTTNLSFRMHAIANAKMRSSW